MQKNISNAFENVSLGDLKYGLLGSVPAEMFHVSGTSLLKYMFGCLDNLIGGTNLKNKIRNHLMIYTNVFSKGCRATKQERLSMHVNTKWNN